VVFEDPALLTWLMILFALVISLAFVSYLYKLRIAARERELELADKGASALELDQVKNRLAVLERIAIDRGHDVAAEIEALRGPVQSGQLGRD
jgi:hypothetical protein